MKSKLATIFLFTFIYLLLIVCLGNIVDKGLRKSKYSFYAVWNDIYGGKVNSDMIFMGNSRTYVMLSPKIFDSVLGFNTYNLGMNGWGFGMEYTRFKIYLQHNPKPKYILQNVDIGVLGDRPDLYEYAQFLPYLNDTLLINVINIQEHLLLLICTSRY